MNTELLETSKSNIEFFVILMTKNLEEQQSFYQNIIGLDVIFQTQDAVGLGHEGKEFLILKYDLSENSHHLSEHKGPSIITFQVTGSMSTWHDKIKLNGFKIRDHLILPEHKSSFLFVEDYEGNEICLSFDSLVC